MPKVAVPTPRAAFLNVGLLINGMLDKMPFFLGAALLVVLRLATVRLGERRLIVFRGARLLGAALRLTDLRLGALPDALRLPAAIRLRNAAFAAPCSFAIILLSSSYIYNVRVDQSEL